MNRSLLLSLAICALISLQSAFAEKPVIGEGNSEFGKYQISTAADAMVIKGKALKTYSLDYEQLDQTVKIGMLERRNCKNFIVRSPNFEISYVCTKSGFGAKMVDQRYATVNEQVVNYILDDYQFKCQEVILSEPRSEEELLQLIACYFPNLIKKDFR